MSRIGTLARYVTYQRSAIALTGLCVAGLYVAVAMDHFSAQAAPVKPVIAKKLSASDLPASPLSAKHRIAAPVKIAPVKIAPVKIAPVKFAPVKFAPVEIAMAGSAENLFKLIDYRLEGVRRHGKVPRIFLASMPSTLPKIRLAAKRKVMFIKTALPLILHVNELIQQDRAEVTSLYAKQKSGAALTGGETALLKAMAEKYGLAKTDFANLLSRVDVIPPSLALAQSAEESGWGTSRFAQKGNALFGQRTFRKDKGIVPKRRESGQTYKVRAFDHLIDGVKSYAHNLNTHKAYRKFRAARAKLRRDGKPLGGYRLAETLTAYSERGSAYIKTLKIIIKINRFDRYDKVRLGDRVSSRSTQPDA